MLARRLPEIRVNRVRGGGREFTPPSQFKESEVKHKGMGKKRPGLKLKGDAHQKDKLKKHGGKGRI